jgi:hypothetical protein
MRISEVVLCGICCCPPNQEIHKTALGAEESVDWRYFKETIEAVETLKEEGYQVFAVEQAHDSVTLEAFVESLTAKRSYSKAVLQPKAITTASRSYWDTRSSVCSRRWWTCATVVSRFPSMAPSTRSM